MHSMSPGALYAAGAALVLLLGLTMLRSLTWAVLRWTVLLGARAGVVLLATCGLHLGFAWHREQLVPGSEIAELRHARLAEAFRRLPFTSPASWEAAQIKARWTSASSGSGKDSAGAAPSAWKQLVRLIKRDYISSWYTHIAPPLEGDSQGAGAFPERVEETILSATTALSSRWERLDVPHLVSTRLVPQVTKHMHDFRRVEALLQPALHAAAQQARSSSSSKTPAIPLDPSAIVQAHFPALHPALPLHSGAGAGGSAPALEAYFRSRVEEALRLLLPAEDRTTTIVTLARELLTCTVLVPLLEMCADPDFWNKMIEEQAGRYLHERQQVSQLRAALETASANDPQVPSPAGPAISGSSPALVASPSAGRTRRSTGAISASTTAQQFDAFLKGINKIRSLAEAKHLRNDIERELRAARAETGPESALLDAKDRAGMSKEQRVYLERLESAERKVLRRIAALGGDVKPDLRATAAGMGDTSAVSLRDVLGNPGALGFFMEYMDRRQAAHLLQFWLTVDSFKDPLAGDVLSDEQPLTDGARRNAGAWPTAGEDIEALWMTYLAGQGQSAVIKIAARTRDGIAGWVQRDPTLAAADTDTLLEQAERSVFQAQRDVLSEMDEDYFPDFKRSELFFKAASEAAPVEARRVSSTLSQPDIDLTASTPALGQKGTSSPGAALSAIAAWRPFVKSGADGTSRRSGSAQPEVQVDASVATPAKQTPLHKARSFSFGMPSRGRQRSAQSSYDRNSRDLSSSPLGPLSPKSGMSHAELSPDPLSLSIVSDDLQPNGRLPDAAEDLAAVEADRIEALQAALTSIIDGSHEEASAQRRPSSLPSRNSGQELLQAFTSTKTTRPAESRKASASGSLADITQSHSSETSSPLQPGLPIRSKPKKVFDDDEDVQDPLSPNEEELPAEDIVNDEASQIQLAGPGDLCLESDIRFLQRRLLKFTDQDALLDKMVRAAELTGKSHELKLLRRSQSDLRRDMRTMQFQVEQFQQQQQENVLLPNLTKASIVKATSSSTDSEKQVVRYNIEMQQLKSTGEIKHCWTVARRYNEFWDLHHELKESVQLSAEMRKRSVDLPSKKLVTFMSDTLIDQRREGLQTYLQRLLSISAACQHPLVRLFLSKKRAIPLVGVRQSGEAGPVTPAKSGKSGAGPPAPKFVRNLYRSLQSSLDDALLGPTAFEVISERLNKQAGDMADELGSSLLGWGTAGMEYGSNLLGGPSLAGQADLQAILQGNLPSTGGLDAALANLPAMFSATDGEGGSSVFTGPICDLFIELFSLKDSSWLKKQSVVMIIQQLLGATIERKVRDVMKGVSSNEAINGHVLHLKQSMWPNDGPRVSSAPRTAREQAVSRARAAKRMQTIVPDVPANIVGRRNARRAMERVHSALQVRILNMHLVLTMIDEIFHALFPELKK